MLQSKLRYQFFLFLFDYKTTSNEVTSTTFDCDY